MDNGTKEIKMDIKVGTKLAIMICGSTFQMVSSVTVVAKGGSWIKTSDGKTYNSKTGRSNKLDYNPRILGYMVSEEVWMKLDGSDSRTKVGPTSWK
jgi:hypothetical protein